MNGDNLLSAPYWFYFFFLFSKSNVIAPTTPQIKPVTGMIQNGIVIVISQSL